MNEVKIGDRAVGEGHPAFVIAELGSNHDRKLDQAKALIDMAADVGADAAKVQLFTALDLYAVGTPEHEAVQAVELPAEWLEDLVAYARNVGIPLLASPFSYAAVDAMEAVGIQAFKWASSEMAKLDLLRHAASGGRPMLLSTGMCDLGDVHEAVQVVRAQRNEQIVLLQCTSLYPTQPDQVNLAAMETLRTAFGYPVGLSDHTMDVVIPAAAVARGACLVEKHLTLDRTLPGPDHGYALEPGEFKDMVKGIRVVEEAIGSGEKRLLDEEARLARRESLRAARNIAEGEVLRRDSLVSARPAGGIAPRLLGAVLGARVRRSIDAGEAITWDVLEDRGP